MKKIIALTVPFPGGDTRSYSEGIKDNQEERKETNDARRRYRVARDSDTRGREKVV